MDTSLISGGIEFDNVTKHYGRVTAVDRLSFRVNQGEVCGFLGPNGAGKTTTLRMLLGLVRPTSGTIRIQGVDVTQKTAEALRGVGAIIEESHFYPYLTGEQNLRQVLRLRGLDGTREEIRGRLEEVGLREAVTRKVKGYSLGMRQRLALALALLQDPRILVLDEPMNGLDPAAMREFRQHLARLAETGVTILLSSHILPEVEQLATRLVFINQGRVVGMDDRQHQHLAVYVRATEPERFAAWLELQGRTGEHVETGGFRVTVDGLEDIPVLIRRLVEAGIDLVEVRPHQNSLEQQYLERMGVRGEEAASVEA